MFSEHALQPEPEGDESASRGSSRRSVLTAGAAAIAAIATQAIVRPEPVAAASVQLGHKNTSTDPTTFSNPKLTSNARALIGQTTFTGFGTATAGVTGISKGDDGNGVVGVANKGTAAFGMWGRSTAGTGVHGSGVTGVSGNGGIGVFGYSSTDNGAGVRGDTDALIGTGVYGFSPNGPGVSGASDNTYGEVGSSQGGVAGFTDGGIAVYGVDDSDHVGFAGYFDGDMYIGGTVYPFSAVRQVDHPDAPGERWYRTAMMGSFEELDVISGNARTGADRRAIVRVPAEFAQFHRDFRYQLTPIGRASAPYVAERLARGRFVIQADRAGTIVSWQVTGVRSDPSARRHGFEPVVTKTRGQRGRFAEPGLYGKAAGRALKPRGNHHHAWRRPVTTHKDSSPGDDF